MHWHVSVFVIKFVIAVEDYVEISRKQCLEEEIAIEVERSSTFPTDHTVDLVGFDVYCNTSGGGPVEVKFLSTCVLY